MKHSDKTLRMIEDGLRTEINETLATYPSCDLADRLRKELRRGYDSNTTNRDKRRAFDERVRSWAQDHLLAAFSDVPLRGLSAWGEFLRTDGIPEGFGSRAFYLAIRRAGYQIGRYGGPAVVISDVELAR